MAHPAMLGIRHVALVVADLAAAERFWTGAMGYEVEWRPDADNVYLHGPAGAQEAIEVAHAAVQEGRAELHDRAQAQREQHQHDEPGALPRLEPVGPGQCGFPIRRERVRRVRSVHAVPLPWIAAARAGCLGS